jgi:hypothetical protein
MTEKQRSSIVKWGIRGSLAFLILAFIVPIFRQCSKPEQKVFSIGRNEAYHKRCIINEDTLLVKLIWEPVGKLNFYKPSGPKEVILILEKDIEQGSVSKIQIALPEKEITALKYIEVGDTVMYLFMDNNGVFALHPKLKKEIINKLKTTMR